MKYKPLARKGRALLGIVRIAESSLKNDKKQINGLNAQCAILFKWLESKLNWTPQMKNNGRHQ